MDKYVIDTNVIINIEERYSFIEGLQGFLDDLYDNGRLVLLKKLKKELKDPTEQTSELWRFSFIDGKDFLDNDKDPRIVSSMAEVMSKLDSSVANDESQISNWTNQLDPWLIIYAHHFKNNGEDENMCVLTEEKVNPRRPQKLKVPYIASRCGIDCCDLQEFLRKEGKRVILV
jgi:hypothetical protein